MNLCRSSLILSLSASMMLSSVMHAADESLTYTYFKSATVGTFVLMLAKFFSTEPHNHPVRYDLEAAKAQLKSLFNGENTSDNLHGLSLFTWYFILDGIIGHASKRPSLRVDPETMKVDARPGACSKGLFGLLHDYAKAPLGIAYLLLALNKLAKELPIAWEAAGKIFDNPAGYRKIIEDVNFK